MNRCVRLLVLAVAAWIEPLFGQASAPASLSPDRAAQATATAAAQPSATAKAARSVSSAKAAAPTDATAKPPKKKDAAIPGFDAPKGPITTQIFADQATFDSGKYIGTFSGHVIVNDPRFNVQADKLTIYINKAQNEGLEKAVAEGNVGVVRERPDPKGGPAERAIGRSEKAVYTAKDGNVELTGSPRVQQGLNSHVATSADTVMILNQNGQLQTKGPSRTEIRQEPKQESPAPEAGKNTPAPSASPTQETRP